MTLKHNQSLGREPWISLKLRIITSLELWTSVGVCPTKFKSRRSHCHSDQVWQRSTLIRWSQSYLKKCAVRQKQKWLLERARSVYQNNSWYTTISLRPTFLWKMRDENKVTGTRRRGSTTIVTVSSFSLLHGCSWLFYKLKELCHEIQPN